MNKRLIKATVPVMLAGMLSIATASVSAAPLTLPADSSKMYQTKT